MEGYRDAFYRSVLLPWKLAGYAAYLKRRTAWSDLGVLWRTAVAVVIPSRTPTPNFNHEPHQPHERGAGPGSNH
ncbi:MAG: hypothetical protein KA419_07375 [Acidobacteria bacterium]|nr:hypothetical protein [Acidobacteriota bacterium]